MLLRVAWIAIGYCRQYDNRGKVSMELSEDEIAKCISALATTGFDFEHRVGKALSDRGWSTIGNRYYFDDLVGSPRELDMVAYRAVERNGIRNYSVVLISAKKAAEDSWVLTTRPLNPKDPNIDHLPVHTFTSSPVIAAVKPETRLKTAIASQRNNKTFLKKLYEVDRSVSAFQCVNLSSGKPHNDRPIYSAIESLVRGLNAERMSLAKRRRETPTFYNFHLVNVLEGTLIEADYATPTAPVVRAATHIKYLNRLIVGDRDEFFRVHFIRFDFLDRFLDLLDESTEWQRHIVDGWVEEFKKNFLTNYEYRSSVRETLREQLLPKLEMDLIFDHNQTDLDSSQLSIVGSSSEPVLKLIVSASDETIEILNKDVDLIEMTRRALQEHCKFEGKFSFQTGRL